MPIVCCMAVVSRETFRDGKASHTWLLNIVVRMRGVWFHLGNDGKPGELPSRRPGDLR